MAVDPLHPLKIEVQRLRKTVPPGAMGGAGSSGSPSGPPLAHNNIFIGDATGFAHAVPTSGDATIDDTGAVILAATGVTAGTYGDSTHYPAIVVNAKGRITLATSFSLPAAPAPANPSGLIGLTAVNGVATTFERSDSTHALDQSIAPNWTGAHTWNQSLSITSTGAGATWAINGEGASGYQAFAYISSTNSPLNVLGKARGTIASPLRPATSDDLGVLRFRGYAPATGAFVTGGELRFTNKETTWDSTARGAYASVYVVAAGATALTEASRTEAEHQQILGPVGIGQAVSNAPAAGFVLDLTSTTGALGFPSMTTTQKNALNSSTPVNRMAVYDSTLGQFQFYQAGAWTGLGGAASGFHPGFGAGLFYSTTLGNMGSNVVMSANVIHAVPFYVPGPGSTTFTKMGLHVVTAAAAGTTAELGIYTNANGAPAALVIDAGNVSTATTGDKELTGLSITLSPGWYWLVLACSAGPTLTGSNVDIGGWIGRATSIGSAETGYTGSWTFSAGALPATFPSPSIHGTATAGAWLRL